MSLKTKRHKRQKDHEHNQTSADANVNSSMKTTVCNIADTINSNKMLIGSIAAACGGAFFLFRTNSGRRIRTDIQNRASTLYDSASGQLSNGWGQVRDFANDMMSRRQSDDEMTDSRHVA